MTVPACLTALLMTTAGVALPTESFTYSGSMTGANQTFTGVPIGTEATGRLVVVSVKGSRDAGGTITNLTIGGITATRVDGQSIGSGSLWMYQAVVPTGTTATIAITWSISQVGASIIVWSLYNLTSSTKQGSTISSTVVSNAITITITPSAASIVINSCQSNNARTFTWSGTGSPTEDADLIYSTNYSHSGSSRIHGAAPGSTTYISTCSSTYVSPLQITAWWK